VGLKRVLSLVIAGLFLTAPHAFASPEIASKAEIDTLVEDCLSAKGVRLIGPAEDVACYNGAIFPKQFLKLADMPETRLTVITSPGGNIATARIMSGILDQRGDPVVIAGQCASACAMVILPGVDRVYIHNTAHLAIHGITNFTRADFSKWRAAQGSGLGNNSILAALSGDPEYSYYQSAMGHLTGHLSNHGVDQGYANGIADQMHAQASRYACKLKPDNYWGLLDAAYVRTFLGDRLIEMEDFVESYDDPRFEEWRNVSHDLGGNTYVFTRDYEASNCAELLGKEDGVDGIESFTALADED